MTLASALSKRRRRSLKGRSREDLEQFFARIPDAEYLIDQDLSWAHFAESVERTIDRIISEMQRHANEHEKDDEDRLTYHLIAGLRKLGYKADKKQQGGNVDLTVEGDDPDWVWIAEAKIDRGPNNTHEGFLQLCTRYKPGNYSDARGGLLIYCFQPQAAIRLQEWKSYLEKQGHADLRSWPCDRNCDLALLSKHTHLSSGTSFTVRHWMVVLHHQPQDKSGLAASKYKT